ncbi:sortase domain-containing protein [Pelomicrobium sp.]|jgi:sortase A|uniref:sortase domain-containing protein n=1 Tax=Pelomicrobium sp. TaxID=2815319 RepID=UPI002FDD85AE
MKPWSWVKAWPVAKLSVPRLGVRLLLLADMGAWGLEAGGSPNAVRSGARRLHLLLTVRGGDHFRFLQALQPADEIRLDTPGGEGRRYRVKAHFIADRRMLPLHLAPFARGLTLVCPYPFASPGPGGALRYVVSCERIEALPVPHGPTEGHRAVG